MGYLRRIRFKPSEFRWCSRLGLVVVTTHRLSFIQLEIGGEKRGPQSVPLEAGRSLSWLLFDIRCHSASVQQIPDPMTLRHSVVVPGTRVEVHEMFSASYARLKSG